METVNVKYPSGLIGAIETFSDPQICLDVVAKAKWGSAGPSCPTCEGKRLSFLQTRLLWKCLHCKKQFSVKVGTIFEDSPIPLNKWLCAMWMLANCENGVSSYEIARALEVTQQTAWFMLQRIRYAMHNGTINKATGHVEADETFIGGKARNMHKSRKERVLGGAKGGQVGKIAVLGILERGGRVQTQVLPNRKCHTVPKEVRKCVEARSVLYTDQLEAYRGLTDFQHQVWITPFNMLTARSTRTGWRTSGAF